MASRSVAGILKKNTIPLKHVTGSRYAAVTIERTASRLSSKTLQRAANEEDLTTAFTRALLVFHSEFKEYPEMDRVVITGSFTTLEVLVEIVEYPSD